MDECYINEWYVNKEDLPGGVVDFSELLCGCGEPGICWDALYDYLKFADAGQYQRADNAFELFFMYVISHIRLTEHGTSIYGAWLTKKGKEVLNWLHDNIDRVDNLVICYQGK
jgi:hypothetical protein